MRPPGSRRSAHRRRASPSSSMCSRTSKAHTRSKRSVGGERRRGRRGRCRRGEPTLGHPRDCRRARRRRSGGPPRGGLPTAPCPIPSSRTDRGCNDGQLPPDQLPAQPRVRAQRREAHVFTLADPPAVDELEQRADRGLRGGRAVVRRPSAAPLVGEEGSIRDEGGERIGERRSASRPGRTRRRRRAPRARTAVSEVTMAQPAAAPWRTLLGTTRCAFGAGPEDPEAHVVGGDQRPAALSVDPVDPGDASSCRRAHGSRRGPGRRPTMVTVDRSVAGRAARARPMSGAPCNGVKRPKKTPAPAHRRPGSGAGWSRTRRSGGSPAPRRPARRSAGGWRPGRGCPPPRRRRHAARRGRRRRAARAISDRSPRPRSRTVSPSDTMWSSTIVRRGNRRRARCTSKCPR